jgi:membrane protease YdiL (CAAX protease family)
VISQRPWPAEAVLKLLGFLLLGLGGIIILNTGLLTLVKQSGISTDDKSISLVLGTLGIHGGALLGVFVFLRVYRLSQSDGLGIRFEDTGRAIRFGVITALLVLPMAWGLGQLIVFVLKQCGIEAPQQDSIKLLMEMTSPWLRVYFGVFAVFIAPVAEEVLFRGIFYPAIKQAGMPRLALWGTSLLFGAIHANLMSFIPLVLLAVVLVKIYEATDNLLTPIIAHSVFNAANLIVLFVFPEVADPSTS